MELPDETASMLRMLKADERVLLILRYVHDFSTADLAATTGLSEGAVRQRLLRARTKVRQVASIYGERK